MVKRPDIKQRKKLRLAMCVLYLLQIVVCTMPFLQNIQNGEITSASPFFMASILFNVVSSLDSTVITMAIICIVIIVIPIAGFLFCALDKERNLKNIASIICCVAGVAAILMIPGQYISLGAVVALIMYVIIMFLTSIAMVMRLSKDTE